VESTTEHVLAFAHEQQRGRDTLALLGETTSTSADPSRADASFALAEKASEEACAGRSAIVLCTRLAAIATNASSRA
jgi:hypothetical protein